jgi:hypothetical protein
MAGIAVVIFMVIGFMITHALRTGGGKKTKRRK